MEIHQSLTKSKTGVRNVLCRHEQGEVFAAEGYAKCTGKVGVCIATSGPGATNLVTGLADALLDSVPMVAITGQVPRRMIGTDAFQETPTVEITRQITKHNYLVMDVNDIPRIVREAFFLASSGRPGPVLIDIPKDVQQQMSVPYWGARAGHDQGIQAPCCVRRRRMPGRGARAEGVYRIHRDSSHQHPHGPRVLPRVR
jgi:acetolactate synthase-1/2/3 large subunit